MSILDPKPLTLAAGNATYAPAVVGATAWAASTVYTAGQIVRNPSGHVVTVLTTHTSTATYDATKFSNPLGYLPMGGTPGVINVKPIGDTRPGVFEMTHNAASGYIFHLTSGATMTGGAIVALGIGDNGATSATGLLISQKNGSSGNAVSLVNQPTTPGRMVNGTHQSTADINPFIFLETANTTGKASPLVQLTANGTPGAGQRLLSIDSGAAPLLARGGHGTNLLRVHADTGTVDVTAPILRVNGGKHRVQATDTAGTFANVSHIDSEVVADEPRVRLRRTLGGLNLFYSFDLAADGDKAHLRAAPAAEPGSEAPVNAVSWSVASGAPTLGFYGTTPVAKPALTYSRATENAAQTQLRTALVALGLVTDSTVV